MRKLTLIALCFLALGLMSCGKVVNFERANSLLVKDLNFNLLEHQCLNNPGETSEIYKKISALLKRSNHRMMIKGLWSANTPAIFNYEKPMIVGLNELEDEYNSIINNPSIESVEQVLELYNKAQRFEDLRCGFGGLVDRKSYDVRPFYKLINQCQIENGKDNCTESDYNSNPLVFNYLLAICGAFYTESHCLAELKLRQENKTLKNMSENYRQRFQDEKINSLFSLTSDHSIFNCQKSNDQTVMNISIMANGLPVETLRALLPTVEKAWESNVLKVKFQIVDKAAKNTVQVIAIKNGISNVPSDNNNLVFLNSSLPFYQMSRVLAHEFGHVLGFPDCYIEFFDKNKKELVYYEPVETNMNIMCSMKAGVSVPNDYFLQLEQSSCNFR